MRLTTWCGLGTATVLLTVSAWSGDISGKVAFEGAAPKPGRLQMNADPVCMKQHKDPVFSEEVLVNKNGTLKNVIVYVKEGLPAKKYPVPTQKPELDQKGCVYIPRVISMQAGQELMVVNNDPTLHNVHSLSKDNPQFNKGQPKNSKPIVVKIEKPETFKVKCDVHPWMGAWVGVFPHPYHAVTGDDGSFNIKELPAGDYTLEAWHEKFGVQTIKVKVAAAGTATADVKFKQ
jgi:plastocyanin